MKKLLATFKIADKVHGPAVCWQGEQLSYAWAEFLTEDGKLILASHPGHPGGWYLVSEKVGGPNPSDYDFIICCRPAQVQYYHKGWQVVGSNKTTGDVGTRVVDDTLEVWG
jgi:hypothetical protein